MSQKDAYLRDLQARLSSTPLMPEPSAASRAHGRSAANNLDTYEFAVLWEQSYYIVWSEDDDEYNAEDFRDAYYFHFNFDTPAVGYVL